jgi:hypothetical protein
MGVERDYFARSANLREEIVVQFMIMAFENQARIADRGDRKKSAPYFGAWQAYTQALRQAGVMVSGNPLEPSRGGATVRLRNGKRQVEDGPYADTKEQLGGYYIIEVANLDAALDWAARCPAAADGAVEVRPVVDMGKM